MRKSKEEYVTSPKLISRLQFLFIKYKMRGDFEDFYHDYVVYHYENPESRKLLEFFTIDQIRKKLGRKGQRIALVNALNIDDLTEASDDDQEISPSYIFFVKELLSKYKGRIRMIVSLYFVHGFTEREIGDLLLVSESRISQLITKIRNKASISDDVETCAESADELRALEMKCNQLRRDIAKKLKANILNSGV